MNNYLTLKIFKFAKYSVSILALAVIIYIYSAQDQIGVACTIETGNTDFGISVFPATLFKAPNIKPGDVLAADLTVTNEGKIDFSHDVSAIIENGDQLLYDALDLVIRDSGSRVLFMGKLKDLNEFSLGVLSSKVTKNKEVLNFSVSLPETGVPQNEYQGKQAIVKFLFNATEHPPYIDGGKVIWDPPLNKPDVHHRRGEVIPISFHLVRNGTFDLTKRGIDLIISGKYNNRPVKYVFRVTDGTLEWKASFSKPHYSLHFDTGKFPVTPDTYYTATVKFGDQVLGSTKFKSGQRR